VLFDDGNNFVIDESPRRLPDEFFFVVQLRIKIDEIDTGKSSHSFLFPSHGVFAVIVARLFWLQQSYRSSTRQVASRSGG
jgi:hypothetical protein